MASINKLSIRGVRAFSPDDEEQVLEFYFPCTIIVGANGCGKTTIIESLKFAVCGAFPPGNKSGQAFVHDPKSIGQSTVKAQIKLRFTNQAGKSMVVLRSMELSQKKKNMTFKQLDGVIRTTDENGQRQSLSHKCTDLDRQLPLYLGVSKAILEHVVFCHQEDANWPLQEGAVLKKRFDDIFDSTRYTKALEVFSKLKKEYTAKVKDIKADVAGFASHLHAARGFQQEIEKYNEQLEEVEEEIADNKKSLKETKEEQDRLNGIVDQISDIQADISDRKGEFESKQELAEKTRELLEEDLTGEKSARELKEMLRDFDSMLSDQVEQKEDLESEITRLKNDISDLTKEDSSLRSKLGRYQAEKDAQIKRQEARFEKMVQVGNSFGLDSTLTGVSQTQTQSQNTSYHASSLLDISLTAGSQASNHPVQLEISKDDLHDFFQALKKKKTELQDNLNQKTMLRQRNEDQMAAQLSEVEGKLVSIENDRAKLKKESDDAQKELKDISSRGLVMSRMRKDDVEEAKRNAAKFAAERDKSTSDPRREEIRVEIKSCQHKIDVLQRDIEDDNDALGHLRENAEMQHEVAILKEQIGRDLEDLKEAIHVSDADLRSRNIDVPTIGMEGDHTGELLNDAMDTLMADVSEKFRTAEDELKKIIGECNEAQRVVSEKRALFSHEKRSIETQRDRMEELGGDTGGIKKVLRVVQELRQFEGSSNVSTPPGINESKPRELLSYLDERLEAEESENVEGIQPEVVGKILKRLKKLAKSSSPSGGMACPCCERDLDSEAIISTFASRMKTLMATDSPLIKADEQNQTSRSNYQEWRKVVTENMNDVLDYRRIANEVNEKERNCLSLEQSLHEKAEDLDSSTKEKDELQGEVDALRELLESCKVWNAAASRIIGKGLQAKNKNDTLSITNDDLGGGRDLKTCEKDLADKMDRKDALQNKIGNLNKDMSNLIERIARVTRQATEADKMSRDKQEKFAGVQKLAERKRVLQDTVSGAQKDIAKIADKVHPLREKIAKKKSERDRMRNLATEDEDEIRKTTQQLEMFENEIEELQKQIEDFDSQNDANSLDHTKQKCSKLASEKIEKEERMGKIQPDLDRLKKALDDQERHKKNLNENINLIGLSSRIREIEKEIQSLQEAAANVAGHETAYDDARRLRDRETEIAQMNARLEGRRGEIYENVRSFKRKLSQPEYKNVEEEHRVGLIKSETTQMAVRDIDKYHSALDKALQRFHSLKIAEINTIIRDLWTLTYKGEDITSIALVSGQDSGSRSSRSYNYRVAMTKGNTQLDMRGRCSAGQRVLASIVIRLALAETFCLNCGCIALDEPTVNLDYRNKKGLAIALAQIIASRSKQRNFQLIMITHDEDFVALLKTELSSQTGFSMPEKYFQVRREEGTDGKYYSKIDAIDWEELV